MDTVEFNRRVGARLRRRRRELGLSQAEVAHAVGVTFQQIQKYERGANLLASRLFVLAVALNVPAGHFFDGLEGSKEQGQSYLRPEDRPFEGSDPR
jgi:transcriptional regulator with XRE-family HTH domain